jgi:hypothetical protein
MREVFYHPYDGARDGSELERGWYWRGDDGLPHGPFALEVVASVNAAAFTGTSVQVRCQGTQVPWRQTGSTRPPAPPSDPPPPYDADAAAAIDVLRRWMRENEVPAVRLEGWETPSATVAIGEHAFWGYEPAAAVGEWRGRVNADDEGEG